MIRANNRSIGGITNDAVVPKLQAAATKSRTAISPLKAAPNEVDDTVMPTRLEESDVPL